MPSDRELVEPLGAVERGDVIGEYRLEKLLGAGATSRVFLGVHNRLGRRAAIKVLSHALVDEPEVIERLLREARVVNDIRHPNIVDISDFIDTPSPRRVALIMEYIEGPSLKALRGHRIDFGQAIGISLQLVAAVKAAHESGVIHRDIKSDNLLLLFDPRKVPGGVPGLKVVDFGLAKVIGPLRQNAATGVMLGTPAYMAPEQIAGRPAPSAATDVYAIAEVIYELLTGDRVFPPKSVSDIIRMKLRGPLPPMVLPETVPARGALLRMIQRCLAIDPSERPDLAALRALLIDVCPKHVLRIGSGTWGVAAAEHDFITTLQSDDDPVEEGTDISTQPSARHPADFETTQGARPRAASADHPADFATTKSPVPPTAKLPLDPTDPVDLTASPEPTVATEVGARADEEPTRHALSRDPSMASAFGDSALTPIVPPNFTVGEVAAPRRSRAMIVAVGLALATAGAAALLSTRASSPTEPASEAPTVVPGVQAVVPATVTVTSEPSGATVLGERGTVLGETPVALPRPSSGRRSVRLVHTGFRSTVTTFASEDDAVHVRLEADPQQPDGPTKPRSVRAEPEAPGAFPSW